MGPFVPGFVGAVLGVLGGHLDDLWREVPNVGLLDLCSRYDRVTLWCRRLIQSVMEGVEREGEVVIEPLAEEFINAALSVPCGPGGDENNPGLGGGEDVGWPGDSTGEKRTFKKRQMFGDKKSCGQIKEEEEEGWVRRVYAYGNVRKNSLNPALLYPLGSRCGCAMYELDSNRINRRHDHRDTCSNNSIGNDDLSGECGHEGSPEYIDEEGAHGNQEEGCLVVRAALNMFEGSTGCFEWDAGYFLAEFILNNPEKFTNRFCVELGSGVGMVGVALARIGGVGPVLCTDGDEVTVQNCAQNLRENNVPLCHIGSMGSSGGNQRQLECRPVVVKQFPWTMGWQGFLRTLGEPPWEQDCSSRDETIVLLGADLLYDPDIIPVIVPLLREALADRYNAACKNPGMENSCAYLSTRRRNEATLEKFVTAVEREPSLILYDITEHALQSINDGGVKFHHIPSLESSRDGCSIVLHKLLYQIPP